MMGILIGSPSATIGSTSSNSDSCMGQLNHFLAFLFINSGVETRMTVWQWLFIWVARTIWRKGLYMYLYWLLYIFSLNGCINRDHDLSFILCHFWCRPRPSSRRMPKSAQSAKCRKLPRRNKCGRPNCDGFVWLLVYMDGPAYRRTDSGKESYAYSQKFFPRPRSGTFTLLIVYLCACVCVYFGQERMELKEAQRKAALPKSKLQLRKIEENRMIKIHGILLLKFWLDSVYRRLKYTLYSLLFFFPRWLCV